MAEDNEAEDIFGPVEAKDDLAHPILSPEEVKEAREKARKAVEADRKRAAMKAVQDEETRRLKQEEGFVSGITSEDEIVTVLVDLPEEAPSITINFQPYWHGYGYKVPRHVARSMQEQMQNSWRAHDQGDGKSITDQFKSRRNTVIDGATGGVVRAPEYGRVH